MVAMVFFDEETEEICREQGYKLILPSDSLRRRLDSKIVTTQLGNEAGAPSVPNVIGKAGTYAELQALADSAKLSGDLVVQTPYGDSGKTTFFIKSEADWDDNAEDMTGQELKVMKRINNKAAAVEACITRHGTIVGPFMTDLTGIPNSPHTKVAGAETICSRKRFRKITAQLPSATCGRWAIGSHKKATAGSSRSTC